jgi:hypothetical protein
MFEALFSKVIGYRIEFARGSPSLVNGGGFRSHFLLIRNASGCKTTFASSTFPLLLTEFNGPD